MAFELPRAPSAPHGELPGIRELEIYTPMNGGPPQLRRVRHLQRNKVTFDSRAALEAALASPVRLEMRADFARFPAYSGASRTMR